MARDPIPTWYFALVVVRDGDRFLLVKERKHGQGWYLPAGRVEADERLVQGAIRETLEESGVQVALDGILKIQHTPRGGTARVRVIFAAHPVGGQAGPTEDSLDAGWFTRAEAGGLRLRGREVLDWLELAEMSDALAPLSLLGTEGA